MIRYALACDDGHDFDAWFRSSADFDAQQSRALVTCPACGSSKVRKAIMAPAVATSTRTTAVAAAPEPEATSDTTPEPAADAVPVIAPDPRQREMLTAMRDLRARILADATDVGPRFVDEARRMHAGEIEKKGIYGQATLEEARALADEGIPVAPLPILPEDRN